MADYTFSAAALKRDTGKRGIRVELIGMQGNGKPSIVSVIAINIYDEAANKSSNGQHRFAAFPAEVDNTKTFMVRVLMP